MRGTFFIVATDARGIPSINTMSLRKLCCCLGVALWVVSSVGFSQQKIRFSHLGVKDGLSQSAVNCIFQDRQGFMWFGTQDGLNRFDGYSFTVFKHNPEVPASISDNFIVSIREDSSGTLWFGTLNNPKTLDRFDRRTETFSHHASDSVDLRTAAGSSVFSSYEDHAGVRWSGSIGGGLTRLDTKTGVKKEFKHDAANPKSLSDNRVYSVFGDRAGTIWVATREGLDRFEPATETFIHFRNDPKNPNSISDNWAWPMFEDRDGTLWVGTVRGGLNKFDRTTGTFLSFKHDASDPKSLSDDFVLSIYQDRSGLLWVGTGNDGLNTFHPGLNAFRLFSNEPSNARSLADNVIKSLYVDRSGAAWIGTQSGLEKFDPRTGTFTHYKNNPAQANSLGENLVVSICEDRSGAMWFGTYSSGLDKFDRTTGTFTHYRKDPANPNSLSDNRVYALLEDRNGVLWVGTYGGGLNRLDKKTGRFTLFAHHDSIATSLSANGVWSLCEDHEGVLWVGTYGGGLNRFHPETETFTAYKHIATNSASLSDDIVICLYEDRLNTLWVGTTAGLNRFDRARGTFTSYREKDGLPNDFIFGILEDDHGNLWLSTNKGLSKFDPRTASFRNFDVNDGLQGNEFNQNAYAKSAVTGEMYFGGNGGFNLFHPDRVKDNPFVPPVVFSAFRRYNTDDSEGKPIEESGIPARQEIHLTYKDNIATFEFAALNFFNTFKNRYAYKLEGFSENWIQLGTEHRATFTNLDPGEYTLRVKGSNNDGVWNDHGAAMKLVVTPPWWKTRWAYAAYVLIFLGVLYQLRSFEINRREQKARVRESELRAKAAEAEKRALEAENERKTKELEEARQLQLSMLPREVPQLPHLDIAVFMKTATEVGGDYYDFQLDGSGTLTVACGDATGHGMQAGTVVTLMKGLFTSDASRLELRTFFNHSSKAIKEIKMGRLLMAFTMVKITGRHVAFATAGMPPVFICRNGDGSIEEVMLKGMPLGAMKNFPYVVHEEELRPGDALLLLSDGLPEQKNAAGEMFDYARVQEKLKDVAACSSQEIISHLARAGEEWMHDAVQEDDITMIVIKMKPDGHGKPDE